MDKKVKNGLKLSKSAALSMVEGKKYCPRCHFPFQALTIISPESHLDKCMQRKTDPKKECPDGIECASSMVSHYQVYSHNTLTKHHDNPGSVPSTPKQSKNIDQLFNSFHDRGTPSTSVKRSPRLLKKCQSTPSTPSTSTASDPICIDLTDSPNSSQEFSVKGSQDCRKKTKLLQSKLSFGSQKDKIFSVKKSPCLSQKSGAKTNTNVLGKHKLPLCKKCSASQSKKRKNSHDKSNLKIEKSIHENPWSITASQVAKSPRNRLKSQMACPEKIIDLTENTTAYCDKKVKVEGGDYQSPKKNVESPFVVIHPINSPAGKPESTEKNVLSANVRQDNIMDETLESWLATETPNKSQKKKNSNQKSSSGSKSGKKSNAKPKKKLEYPIQSTQKPQSFETTEYSFPGTLETQDSEEWSVPPPRGPGFAPVTPIKPENSSLSVDLYVNSDSEMNPPKPPTTGKPKHTKENNLKKDKNANVLSDGKSPGVSGDKLHKKPDKKIKAENDDADFDSCDEMMDTSLLLGVDETQHFLGNPAATQSGISPISTDEPKAKVSAVNTAPHKETTNPTTAKPSSSKTRAPQSSTSTSSSNSRQNKTKTKPTKTAPDKNVTFHKITPLKSKTKQGDIGSMLFGMEPTVKQEKKESAWPKENMNPNSADAHKSDDNKYSDAKKGRKCPFYKKVAGTNIAVDAFSYQTIEGIEFYFLSHFHYDHYMGLTKKSWKHRIFCSQVTGNLVAQKIGLPEELIIRLPMNEDILIGKVKVTLLEANHCPGAVLFLFKLQNNRVILHTGDFRAHPDMEDYDALQGIKVHTLYLDTTYLNPEYRFPYQRDVINTAVSIAERATKINSKALIVVGTYSIGKERIFQAIAKAIKSSIFVTADKFRITQCLEDKELSDMVRKKPEGARVHVAAMKFINVKDLKARLKKYKDFEEIVAIKPTGWTHDSQHPNLNQIEPVVSGPVKIYGLPYSEHSSFEDLRRFVKFLRPEKIIPTVNVGKKETRDMMNYYLDKWKLGLDP